MDHQLRFWRIDRYCIGWIYLVASLPDENTSLYVNIGLGLIGVVLAGLSVEAVTGVFLIRMKPKQLAE